MSKSPKPIAEISTEHRPLFRINFNPEAKDRPSKTTSALIQTLADELVSAFSMPKDDAIRYLIVPDTDKRKFVVNALQQKGWKIKAWQLPDAFSDSVKNHGFEIEENCERLVAWKLTHT